MNHRSSEVAAEHGGESSFASARRHVGRRRQFYASKACHECKRRKVKCNGEPTCSACKRSGTQCVYPEKRRANVSVSTESTAEIRSMRRRLDVLENEVSGLRDAQATVRDAVEDDISTWYDQGRSTHPGAVPVLDSQDHPQAINLSHSGDTSATAYISPVLVAARPYANNVVIQRHPLLSISGAEAIYLLQRFQDECGDLYPAVDASALYGLATDFYSRVAASQGSATWQELTISKELQRPLQRLMVVLATGAVIANPDSGAFSRRLVDAVEAEIDHRPCGVKGDAHLAEMLFLLSLYQFYRSEEVLAWRTVGLAALIALEIGWHLGHFGKQDIDAEEAQRHNRLFWCIYVFDRHCSLGTGLPFAINDSDLDPDLPEPQGPSHHTLRSLVAHARLAYKIWNATSTPEFAPHSSQKEQAAFFTYQVAEWQSSLSLEATATLTSAGVSDPHLQAFFHLQTLHLRMLTYRHALILSILPRMELDAPPLITDMAGARKAISYASDMIDALHDLDNDHKHVYTEHRVCFNYFLYAALTMLAIASLRSGPGTALANTSAVPIRKAMGLLEGAHFSTGSEATQKREAVVAQRIADTTKRLRVRLGEEPLESVVQTLRG